MIRSLPDAGATWRRVVTASADSTLAHAPEWLPIIKGAYGHDPLYLSAEDDDGCSGVLPAFVVRRPLVGTVVTSMPFLDSGGPCTASPALARILVDHLLAEARDIGARMVELRSSTPIDINVRPTDLKVNMTLPIPTDLNRLWRQLDKSVRNQIRKAGKSGLSVDVGGAELLPAFYDTFAERMRDLGSPVHAPGFLRAVLEAFGDRARILLVRKGHLPIGGLMTLAFKDRLTVPWATCLKEYFSLCPNMLLYWEALAAAGREGFRSFDFGRSSRNSGTYQFKCQWGAKEEPLFWYRIPIPPATHRASPHGLGSASCLVKAWQHLPLVLTRQLGPHIRRYLTQ